MKLRGALLGAGNIALKSHAPQWAQNARLREEVEIVAVADLSPANLERARRMVSADRGYARAEDLLRAEDLDFCDICTPPFTHRALIELAAERRVHVLCEKPLAPTLEDTDAIVRAVRGSGIVFQPCHQYHHSPQWQAVKALLPRIGRVLFAEYEVHRTGANPGNAAWNPGWRTDASLAGGGILMDHGTHILYQLAAVLGPPKTVQATVRTLKHHGYGVEDTALLTVDHGTALAQIRLTWAARRRSIRFRFVGESGELAGDDHAITVQADTTETVAFDRGLSRDSSHAEWYAPLLTDFVARVRNGDCGTEGLEEAASLSRIISLAYLSSAQAQAQGLVGPPPAEPSAVRQALELASAELAPSFSVPKAPREGGSRLLRWAGLFAFVAALHWTFSDVHWGNLRHALAGAQMGWIALAALVNFAVLYFQAARWLAVVRPFSADATIGQAFKAMLVGFAVSMVVPARAGELARAEWFGKATLLSRVSVLGSIVVDHLVNATGLLIGMAFLPLLMPVPLWLRPGAYSVLALFAVAAMAVVALGSTPIATGVAASRLPLRVTHMLTRARQGLAASRDPSALSLSLGASLVAWGLEINVTALSLRAMGLHLPLAASILVLVAVNLALAVPFAPPGNAGTLELGATLALVGFGVPKEQALAFALCYHLLQVVPIAILGFFVLGRALPPRADSAWSSGAV